MKKINSFNIIGLVVALFVTSMCLTGCSGFSNSPDDWEAPEKKVTPSDPSQLTPDPSQPQADTIGWKQAIRKYFKVEPTADVTSVIVGQRNNGDMDSLVLKYKYIYSLAADTTIYLESAPTGSISFTADVEKIWFSEYTINEQGDSVATINYAKPYTLSNGVPLSLSTQRIRGWHMMGGQPIMYSEPNQSVGRMTISSTTTEFERNDSIFGLRTNLCSVPLTLGGVQFAASATVKEIWFSRLKETPEPSYNVVLSEPATYICASKCKVSNKNWKDCFLFKGKTKVHIVVAHLDSNGGRALSYEVKSVDLSRVAFNSNVNGVIYDSQTGSYIPALITPDNKDKNGWFTEGVIDGRSVTYDPSKAQAIDEGIKNFVDKNTSVPTPFFMGGSSSSTTWHEYKYTSVSWSKYASDTDMITQKVVVKMPTK